ncbi:MAG: hypothetical protein FWG02_09525 [Holophagaceae bacterium]|nr:hypothetical protein [Holophagaceae bacterium]
MKVFRALPVLFAPVIMFAQGSSRDLDLRFQIGAELTRPYQSLFAEVPNINHGGYDRFFAQPDYQIGLQVRMIGELPGTHGFYYELGGRLETSSRLDFNTWINGVYVDTHDVQVSYSYFTFGGAYIWASKFGLSVGCHLEGRIESISSSGPVYQEWDYENPGKLDGKSTYLRPWGRLSMDFTFNNRGKVRPLIGIEGAYPLLNREQRNHRWYAGETQEPRMMETIAPRGSVACYAGFRF